MNEQKVAILVEALPYIKEFAGKTFVIKFGGSIMSNEKSKNAFMEDIALLNLVGINLAIVHGGGPYISKTLKDMNIESEFISGLRVTSKEAIKVVEMVLSGLVNKELSSNICRQGITGVGLSGKDANLIEAKKKYLYKDGEKIDLGYVGEVTKVNTNFLSNIIEKHHIPVISPIGGDNEGNTYNINADFVAAAISGELKAEKLILLTDVEGIYKDINNPASLISIIKTNEIKGYIEDEVIIGGMLPKVECCIKALEGGTKRVHLIDGRKEHSLLLEIFTNRGIGTMIEIGGK